MKKMMQLAGFTLIELVVVIIILGILSTIATPKFFNYQTNAQLAAAQGVAGALASASSQNYGMRQLNTISGFPLTDCADAQSGLQGGMPTNYSVTGGAVTASGSVSCQVWLSGSTESATYTVIGTT